MPEGFEYSGYLHLNDVKTPNVQKIKFKIGSKSQMM